MNPNPGVIAIGGRPTGEGFPVYVVAEVSANHNQKYDRAAAIVEAAAKAGADAVKLQTYTPDTLTIDCDNQYFRLGGDSPWAGKTLYELYGEAFTPWEWQPRLKKLAEDLGIQCFSTPFDETAVDFLEKMDVPAYKIASFELTDMPLLRKAASAGKPVIASTGTATLEEIDEAVETLEASGAGGVALLKCTSAYPARPEEMNLRAIPFLMERYRLPVGLSDHSLGDGVACAAVAAGACIVEKHITLSRADGGPDSGFSMEAHEFAEMVKKIRDTERVMGSVTFHGEMGEKSNRVLRRSIFVVEDIHAGEPFTRANIRIIRPGHGLAPRHFDEILGRRAACDIARGTPLTWNSILPIQG